MTVARLMIMPLNREGFKTNLISGKGADLSYLDRELVLKQKCLMGKGRLFHFCRFKEQQVNQESERGLRGQLRCLASEGREGQEKYFKV